MIDNITDWALDHYRTIYKDNTITKEDIFYYTYGVLHSPGFRKKYQAFLVRGIPNIPYAPDFRAFEKAGRELAQLHLNYETGPRYDLGESLSIIPDQPKKVEFGTKEHDGNSGTIDETTLFIDGILVYDNLPPTKYKVNGKTPIGWFAGKSGNEGVSRYSFRTNKESGITNYPLEGITSEQVRGIIERLVYVGVESDKIISGLPEEFEMDIESEPTGLDMYTKAAI